MFAISYVHQLSAIRSGNTATTKFLPPVQDNYCHRCATRQPDAGVPQFTLAIGTINAFDDTIGNQDVAVVNRDIHSMASPSAIATAAMRNPRAVHLVMKSPAENAGVAAWVQMVMSSIRECIPPAVPTADEFATGQKRRSSPRSITQSGPANIQRHIVQTAALLPTT
ncbi:hypothetical protein KCP75_10700 [Salmonella enterica subsp. enterica]|nr:hypothetical protein KCP75_10700 [Salmonella enterica subsp. enterica]